MAQGDEPENACKRANFYFAVCRLPFAVYSSYITLIFQ